MNAPIRLIDDATLAKTLRDDLAHCSQDSAYDAHAGLARFQATLAAAPPSSTPRSWSPRAWFGIGSALLASGIALWWALRPADVPTMTQATTPPSIDAAQPSSVPAVDMTRETTATPLQVEAPPEPQTVVPEPVSVGADDTSRQGSVRAVKAKPELRREIALIARARQVIDENPALAYRLTQRLAVEFPDGVLREEREGLGAIALWNMGQHERAQERAREFLRRYQGSAMRDRLQSISDGTHK